VARLFIAVWPPPPLVTQLRELDRPVRPGLRWTTEDQWHVTVRFLGTVDSDTQHRLQVLLDRVAAQLEPVEVTSGPAPVALGRAVWVLPVEGLGALAARLASVTAEIGEAPSDRPFRGHITLARARRPAALAGLHAPVGGRVDPVADRRAGRVAGGVADGVAGGVADGVAGRWRVTEITLVQSDLRPDGARYQVVRRCWLGGR
jgi:2'-5' RNA ligase